MKLRSYEKTQSFKTQLANFIVLLNQEHICPLTLLSPTELQNNDLFQKTMSKTKGELKAQREIIDFSLRWKLHSRTYHETIPAYDLNVYYIKKSNSMNVITFLMKDEDYVDVVCNTTYLGPVLCVLRRLDIKPDYAALCYDGLIKVKYDELYTKLIGSVYLINEVREVAGLIM